GRWRVARSVSLAVCRRETEGQRLEDASRSAGRDERIHGDEQSAGRAGLSLCGADDLLRVHAGRGDGQRSCRDLLPLRRAYFARSRYCPDRGSTRTFSPGLMNSGTCTVTPFESFAGFVLAVFVAVFITGDVSDRKSTRLNSSHVSISYAVFCLKKKNIIVVFFHCI